MEWNWLHSLIFGLISGFAEFLPVSSEAHQFLFAMLTGVGEEMIGFRLVCRIFTLAALIAACRPQLIRLSRDRRVASRERHNRRHGPGMKGQYDMRVLTTAAVPLLISLVFYLPAAALINNALFLALLLLLNGLILYLPQRFPNGNKESRTMSAVDSFLFGLGGAIAALPGISRTGCLMSAGRLRGGDGRYIADMTMLLCIPALIILIGLDVYAVIFTASSFSLSYFIHYLLAAVSAFFGAYFSVLLVRFLSVKVGFSGFTYYSWGAALFVFVLYLTI